MTTQAAAYTTFKQALGGISGGQVLDVATGNGSFVRMLLDSLGSCTGITGVDRSERAIKAAAEAFTEDGVLFVQMDAEHLDWPDGSFDTVCISNSLHHMADLPRVLAEMRRVLRPGGLFVIGEMYRDGQTEAQRTHVLLHHWWAAVDTALGVTHHETFKRRQVVNLARGLGLAQLAFYDVADLDADPKDAETVKELEGIIDRTVQRAQGAASAAQLCRRGEELRRRVRAAGFHSATVLLAVGERGT